MNWHEVTDYVPSKIIVNMVHYIHIHEEINAKCPGKGSCYVIPSFHNDNC